ncbi:MAG: hypothetical protein ACI87A_003071, partial [Planctomycetota bacterium]
QHLNLAARTSDSHRQNWLALGIFPARKIILIGRSKDRIAVLELGNKYVGIGKQNC